ncbi:MAG: ISAzo13 family transposase [Microscillaceae bacterium]|nr:ISAzo13 family transposase [Microscillaceae bacterium]
MVGRIFFVQWKICQALDAWLEAHKAGSPTDSKVFWIHYRPGEIAQLFKASSGHTVSHGLIKRRLLFLGFGYRKMAKELATGNFADRNLQFQIISNLVLAMSLQSPILSIDCKKKEVLGNLYRDGKCYTQGQIKVYDHDYSHLSTGKVIPHGIYDLQRNEGYITIGTSHETAAFITDNLRWWWEMYGIHQYPEAKNILIFCDAGGANGYRHHIFKQKLLELADEIGKNLIICHYPPYSSKWNPIEHRLFAHVHLAMQGFVLDSYETVKILIDKTTTSKGLKVICRIVDKQYPIGEKIAQKDRQYHRIQFNPVLPKLSYQIYQKEQVI